MSSRSPRFCGFHLALLVGCTIKVAAPKEGRVDCDRFSGIRIVRGELVQSPAVGKDATRRRCSSSCFRPALAAAAASEPPEDKTGRIDGRRAQLRPLSFWSDVSARQSVLEFLSVVSARQSAKDGVPRACYQFGAARRPRLAESGHATEVWLALAGLASWIWAVVSIYVPSWGIYVRGTRTRHGKGPSYCAKCHFWGQ